MTENQKKLINLLKEMFQFDQADLDFGIYRIMRMKREEISRFIEEDLPAQITNELHELVSISAEADITEIDNQIAEAKSLNISETAKASIIAELEEKKKTLAEKIDISSVEADIYNHLTNFFSRYYDEGDFISQRRYKDGAYAIPYEGEEVKLYWANADQYYISISRIIHLRPLMGILCALNWLKPKLNRTTTRRMKKGSFSSIQKNRLN